MFAVYICKFLFHFFFDESILKLIFFLNTFFFSFLISILFVEKRPIRSYSG